jgi:hypothetical protein
MFRGLRNIGLDKCDKVVTKEGDIVTEKYVLYKKDGTEVVVREKVTNLTELDAKIADLQATKTALSSVKEV